ncbi:hypothetical protein KUL156_57370 [Alteromonas sp. KUL156]|nr:hypothetical protein KUL118_15540 [Tenacibaculum sp. KUL118]GFD91375.1 hypothetical protein KUL154_01080 [Alteromonas sp. KUL154]GFE03145.1 hypothetical protein KUL156_57370 [Alteromonas sp. KUL156]
MINIAIPKITMVITPKLFNKNKYDNTAIIIDNNVEYKADQSA